MDNITNLPNEIFVKIMEELTLDDLQALTRVSKTNNDRIQSEAKRMLSRKYPDFLQFYDGSKSYLYYFKTIEDIFKLQPRYYELERERLSFAFNTGNLPISKFYINRYVEDLNTRYNSLIYRAEAYDGNESIPELLYTAIGLEILRSPKITIEILEYIKNLYPGVFEEIEVPKMDNWQVVGTFLYNVAGPVGEMYSRTDINFRTGELYNVIGVDKWLIPGKPIFEWLRVNSNWIELNPEWLSFNLFDFW